MLAEIFAARFAPRNVIQDRSVSRRYPTMDDRELEASQWIPLGQILERIPLERGDALRACLLRGLDRVRPAVLYFDEVPQPLAQLGDAYHDGCVRAALTPRVDRHPNNTDDPSALTADFHVFAVLAWALGKDLEVDTAPWKAWKLDRLPELRRCGLLHGQQARDAPPKTSTAHSSKVVRLKDAPAYLGMNKNTFNRSVWPQLTELPGQDRAVSFNRTDLDEWVDQQTGRVPHDGVEWQGSTQRLASLKGARPGTSTGRSPTPTFDKACELLTERRPNDTTQSSSGKSTTPKL